MDLTSWDCEWIRTFVKDIVSRLEMIAIVPKVSYTNMVSASASARRCDDTEAEGDSESTSRRSLAAPRKTRMKPIIANLRVDGNEWCVRRY